MTRSNLAAVEHALLDEGRDLTHEELTVLSELDARGTPALAAVAHAVRLERCGPTVEVEGILSAKTGGCPEDCHFCSQSSRFSDSPVRPSPILDLDEILAAARETERPRRQRILHRVCGTGTRPATHRPGSGGHQVGQARDRTERCCKPRDPDS